MKKKITSAFMAISICLVCLVSAFADDTGINLLNGPESELKTVNLDDFQEGDTASLDGVGEVTLAKATITGKIPRYSDKTFYNPILHEWYRLDYYDQGEEALFYWIQVDILNTQTTEMDYTKLIRDPVCTFDNTYEFGGWVRQEIKLESEGASIDVASDTPAGSPISSMYRGKYNVVFTLPRDVVKYMFSDDDPKPIHFTFYIGDNKITHNFKR